jgi:hypothetical protein
MQALNKQAEAKLISAIERAATFANEGMSPNDAIIKSAGEANVPAGHINLMVHAYNTGRTTKQREAGEDTLQKAADFQLADADVVLKALYPETVKTSAEISQNSIVSAEYAVSPVGMLQRRQAEMRKAAAAKVALPEKTYVPPPRDEHAAAMRSQSEKVAAQRAADEKRRLAFIAYNEAAADMAKLAEYFRRPGNMPFQDALREVGLRFGDSGVAVLNKVAEVYPHFAKQASAKANYFGNDDVYGLVTKVVNGIERYNDLKSAVPELNTKVAQKKNLEPAQIVTGSVLNALQQKPLQLKTAYNPRGAGAWNNAGPQDPDEAAAVMGALGIGGDEPPPPPPNDMPRYVPDWNNTVRRERDYGDFRLNNVYSRGDDSVLSSIGGMLAGPQQAAMGAIGKELFDPAKKEKMKRQEYEKLTSPDHETALKNIKAQATLHDLLLNDDVVSGHDPKEVAVAFNEIANAAPGVVDSPAVLQALLRKRLESGQLADFDVKQLLEMDKLKAERDKLRTETMEKERNLVA